MQLGTSLLVPPWDTSHDTAPLAAEVLATQISMPPWFVGVAVMPPMLMEGPV